MKKLRFLVPVIAIAVLEAADISSRAYHLASKQYRADGVIAIAAVILVIDLVIEAMAWRSHHRREENQQVRARSFSAAASAWQPARRRER